MGGRRERSLLLPDGFHPLHQFHLLHKELTQTEDGVEPKMPISKSPSYIVRNTYSYCFRLIVPSDLYRFVGKKELRYSLKTGYIGIAKTKARILAGQVQLLFRFLRKGERQLSQIPEEKIQELVQQYLKGYIEGLETRYYEGDIPFIDTQDLHDYIRDLDIAKEDVIEALGLGDYSSVEEIALRFFEKNGIDGIEKGTRGFIQLCRGILKAQIQGIDIEKKYMKGEYSHSDQYISNNQTQVKNINVQKQASETFGDVLKKYWFENAGRWKPTTKTDYGFCKDHLLNFFGSEAQIHTITYEKAREYKEISIDKGNKGRKLSDKRINFYIGFASQVFNYAVRNHYVETNPFEGLKIIEKKRRPDEERDAFDLDDLKKIFCHSREYSEDKHIKPSNFWIPLLALYTGARREELCQLYISDVREIDKVWCLDINDNKPDKSVKTSERRVVPLHRFLTEDLNFIEFVKSLPDKQGRLFSEFKGINNKYGHSFGKWFGRFKEKCGIEAEGRSKKVFHSFRHTFINTLKQAMVNESLIAETVGHAVPGETSGRYGKRYNPNVLYEEVISKLYYDIDLSHLKNSKYVIKD